MSLSDRRAFLAAAVSAALAGCGFRPVYGPSGSAEGLRGEVEIEPPRDRAGFDFVQQMEARLGVAETPRYKLEAQIGLQQSRLGITRGQEITRINILGRVRYALRDIESGRVVSQGLEENFTSYSATGTPFATETARADASKRLMVILADQVVSRLLVTSESWRR